MEIKLNVEYYIERDQKHISINGVSWKINTLEDLGDIVKDYVEGEFEEEFEEVEEDKKEEETNMPLLKEKIKVLIKQPGKEPELKEIGTSLADYQAAVNGYIESIPFPGMDDIDIVLNEMGKLNGMDKNIVLPEYGDVVMGPIVILGVDEKSCIWTSIPENRIEEIKAYIAKNAI